MTDRAKQVYRGDLIFTKHEVDITTVTNVNKTINIVGNLLMITNNIIPVGGQANALVKPTIRFNSMSAKPLDLLPFGIFRFVYGSVYINSTMITNIAGDMNVYTPLVLYSSYSKDTQVFNFRDSQDCLIGRNPGVQVNAGYAFTVPIPLGAKSCILNVINNGAVPDVTVSIEMNNGLYPNQQIFEDLVVGQFHLPIDVRGYETLVLRSNASVGDPTGFLSFQYKFTDY